MNSIEAELVVKGLSDLGSVTARTAAPWRNFSLLHALMTLPQARTESIMLPPLQGSVKSACAGRL